MDRGLARHPAVFVTIMAACTLAGIAVGYHSKDFGSAHRTAVTAGAIYGCMFGIYMSFLWGLIAAARDL